MSRPSHLPPRCPPNGKSPSVRTIDSSFHTTQAFNGLRPKHRNSPSQGSLLERQPSWPGGLLSYPETNLKGMSLQRSASDPIAIMEAATTFRNHVSPVNGVNPISTSTFDELSETVGGKEEGGFEAGCVFGPNSPGQRSALTDSENSMVIALLENIPRNPFQYKCMDTPSQFNVGESAGNQGGHVGASDDDVEKALRRRSGGQRSRIRKIQYIAELERNVLTFQNRGVELAARVASQFQQQTVLSIENENLKQQFLLLRQ